MIETLRRCFDLGSKTLIGPFCRPASLSVLRVRDRAMMQRVVDAGTTGFGAAEIKVLSQWVVVRHDRNNCPDTRDCHLTIIRWDGRRHSRAVQPVEAPV